MTETILYVGLDTDKKFIDVSIAEPLPGGEVRYWGKIANEPTSVDRLAKRLLRDGRSLEVCYEAGPCGYGLYRQLNGKPGVRCRVIAPSMTPRRPGVRVKTNRRDSLTLAKLLRAEELTAVWVPDEAHEAMRDLVRARRSAVADVTRSRQRISSFLLRQRIGYDRKPWTKTHRAWLGKLAFAAPAHRFAFDEMLSALDRAAERRDRLTAAVAELTPGWSLAWLVEALQAMRGYQLTSAAALVAEIGDPRRFDNPRQLMSFVGMTPSEHSTGDSVRRGPLTKAGNCRARTTVIEAAWTYARPARVVVPDPSQPEVGVIAEKARHRLSARYRKLIGRGKKKAVAIAAVARESLGFIWAIARAAGARHDERRPKSAIPARPIVARSAAEPSSPALSRA